MKRLFATLISLVLLTGAMEISAQTNAKLGYINSAELMQMMPGRDTVEAAVTSYGATLDNTVQTMYAEYQTKLQDYQNNASTMSQVILQAKQREISDLEGRIQEFQKSAEEDYQQKRVDLYNPLLTRAKDAIEAVAKDQGYTYVFDTSMGTLLFFENGDNLLPLVKTKLGI